MTFKLALSIKPDVIDVLPHFTVFLDEVGGSVMTGWLIFNLSVLYRP